MPVEAPTWLNSGDTSWQITAATLVGLMSIPGLAVLYGGVMQKRWSINSMMLTFVAFCVVLIVAIVISLVAAGKTSSRGCIYVTIPAATGAEQINQCGDAARATCLSTSTPGAFAPQAAQSIAAECHKARLPTSR